MSVSNDASSVPILEMRSRMRARLYEGMRRIVSRTIIPHLQDPEAVDQAEHIERTLDLLLVDELWSPELNEAYALRAGLEGDEAQVGAALADSREVVRALAADKAAAGALEPLAAEEWLQTELATRRDRDAAPSPPTDPGISEEEVCVRLTTYLQRRLARPQLKVASARRIPGGRSKQTFGIHLTDGSELPGECILRVDRSAALIPSFAADEFDLLQRIAAHGGIPVARPLLAERETEVLGGTFVLFGKLSGVKAGEFFPGVSGLPDKAADVLRDLAAILGRLHRLDPAALGLAAGPPDEVDAIRREIQAVHRRGRESGLRAPEFEGAARWLLANAAAAASPLSVRHGDIGLHNLLVQDGRVTGVLDWELAKAGPAAADLAAIRHVVELALTWDEFAKHYLAAGGPAHALGSEHLDFHTALLHFRVTETSHLCAAMFRDGVSDDFVLANAGFDSAVRARALLAGTIARLVDRNYR